MANKTTVQDGSLTDPATWGGTLPLSTQSVEIRHRTELHDGEDVVYASVLINNNNSTTHGQIIPTGVCSLTAAGGTTISYWNGEQDVGAIDINTEFDTTFTLVSSISGYAFCGIYNCYTVTIYGNLVTNGNMLVNWGTLTLQGNIDEVSNGMAVLNYSTLDVDGNITEESNGLGIINDGGQLTVHGNVIQWSNGIGIANYSGTLVLVGNITCSSNGSGIQNTGWMRMTGNITAHDVATGIGNDGSLILVGSILADGYWGYGENGSTGIRNWGIAAVFGSSRATAPYARGIDNDPEGNGVLITLRDNSLSPSDVLGTHWEFPSVRDVRAGVPFFDGSLVGTLLPGPLVLRN